VGATPSSDSFKVRAREEKKCMFSALSLRGGEIDKGEIQIAKVGSQRGVHWHIDS